MTVVKIGDQKLEAVPEFCHLRDILSAGDGCVLDAVTLCKYCLYNI